MFLMRAVVWMSQPLADLVVRRVAAYEPICVRSAKEFLEAAKPVGTVAFLDAETLALVGEVSHVALTAYVIAVCSDQLAAAIGWLQPYPWVSSVVSAGMFEHPMIERHLDHVIRTGLSTDKPRLLDWLAGNVQGRRVRLTHASKRAFRIEKMAEFFESHQVGSRTLQHLRDAAEELLTNAFYDAPVAAGLIPGPVSRAKDIALPEDNACDLAYGYYDEIAVVRVRDPFGALSRRRLVEVLERCARSDMSVDVDETMGGAGLGMWRIFSTATFVAASVVKNRQTEILVGIAKKAKAGTKPFAFHLYFRESKKRKFWQVFKDETTARPSIDNSVIIKRN